jgi:hypothetical protein
MAEEWFAVVNPAPRLPNATWEEKPSNEEIVQVEVLPAKLLELKARKLTGAAVALSFSKRLT